jgi:hypothetical protein
MVMRQHPSRPCAPEWQAAMQALMLVAEHDGADDARPDRHDPGAAQA